MKLLVATVSSSALAQFANFAAPDALSTFTIPEAGLDLGTSFDAPDSGAAEATADLGPVSGDDLLAAFETFGTGDDGDEERYGIFSTSAAPTTAAVDKFDYGFDCWKCDRMTFADCALLGDWNNCPSGDYDVCFMELRSVHNSVQQVCTGCKDGSACEHMRLENFRSPTTPTPFDQCRPTEVQQNSRGRFGNSRQSVCRTCFNTCDSDSPHHDPKLWCPTYHTTEGTNFIMDAAAGSVPADLSYPDQESFQIPQWDRTTHWKLGSAPGHDDHKDDMNFWRVDLVATQMNKLNTLIVSNDLEKSDFDGDIDYNADGTINQNNSG